VTEGRTGEDAGEADPRLAAALLARDPAGIRAALLAARVLVPVVATGEDSESAVMAVPRLVGADGRHALPVFSCYESLRAWRANARPVAMPGERAVAAALDEGYAAIVVDVAGPASHVVELRAATL
jgi:SseB protein N-terminal domain